MTYKVVTEQTLLNEHRLIEITWNHPQLGDIREDACHTHYRAVADALHTLGVGFSISDGRSGDCVRCTVYGQGVREWLPFHTIDRTVRA